MASLDELEGELIEGTSTIVLLTIVVFVIWLWWKWEHKKVPYQLYPDSIVGSIASGIDYLFSLLGLTGTNWSQAVDAKTGAAYMWASSNLPSYVTSQSWATYEAGRSADEDSSIEANDLYGNGN